MINHSLLLLGTTLLVAACNKRDPMPPSTPPTPPAPTNTTLRIHHHIGGAHLAYHAVQFSNEAGHSLGRCGSTNIRTSWANLT